MLSTGAGDPTCRVYRGRQQSGGMRAETTPFFTGYSPFTYRDSLLSLGERSWKQERTSFAYLVF